MIQQIKSAFDDRVLYECEAETMLEALQKAVKDGARLNYASLNGASLNYASLNSARLNGASLNYASLNGASLNYASLTGASLNGASLNYASLNSARLNGASLNYASLNGASLNSASLNGASLNSARLNGASLNSQLILNIVQCAGIGSVRRMTTAVILADAIEIHCGCFRGPLAKFSARIEVTHAANPRFLAEYRTAVAWIEACAAACRTEQRAGAKPC